MLLLLQLLVESKEQGGQLEDRKEAAHWLSSALFDQEGEERGTEAGFDEATLMITSKNM